MGRQRRGEGSGGAEGAEPPMPRSAVAAECLPARPQCARASGRAGLLSIHFLTFVLHISLRNINPLHISHLLQCSGAYPFHPLKLAPQLI